jgi:hypothetical protein
MITGHRAVTWAICVVWGAPFSFVGDTYTEGHRKESRVQDPGEQSYPGDNGVGASSSSGGTVQMVRRALIEARSVMMQMVCRGHEATSGA